MSLLLRDTARYGIPSFRLVVVAVVLLFVGTGFGLGAEAQPSTKLKLIDLKKSGDLSSGTQVAVFSRKGSRAYPLLDLDLDRKEIGSKIREGSMDTLRLGEGGKTPRPFEQTGASGKVYYMLALTPEGELLESYPNVGGDYQPGLARVESGRIVMGPVPEEHQEPLRGALTSAMGSAQQDTTTTGAGNNENAETGTTFTALTQGGQDGTGNRSSGASGGILSALMSALDSWYGGVVIGLLIGGGGVWGALYRKYSGKLSRRQKRISKLKRDLYNERKSENDNLGNSYSWNNSESKKK